jgi:predicted dehydrogenase
MAPVQDHTVAQFNNKPDYRRDGVILNWSHEIDLALHLLGHADVTASSVKLDNGHDVLADICLNHGGVFSVVHLDYLTNPELRQTIISGTDGQIILDLVSRNAWLRDPRGGVREHIPSYDNYDMNYREEMQDFIDMIDGKGNDQRCTPEQALAVVDICSKVREQAGLA